MAEKLWRRVGMASLLFKKAELYYHVLCADRRKARLGITMDAEIGIIGGSGFYSLLDGSENVTVETDFGKPSDSLAVGMIGGRRVAFLPRHGRGHNIPPQKVPYRANIAALAGLGAKRIIATAAVGSLKEEYKPGEFVLFDQFVNMTYGRQDTYFDKNLVAHVGMAEPYCESMRKSASRIMDEMDIAYHGNGTALVINGPRFSSKAESRFFSSQGFETINMTQYPEVALAREKALCYLGIGIITDYDAGLEGRKEVKPVTVGEINRVFGQSIEKAKELITKLAKEVSVQRSDCRCAESLDGAVITH